MRARRERLVSKEQDLMGNETLILLIDLGVGQRASQIHSADKGTQHTRYWQEFHASPSHRTAGEARIIMQQCCERLAFS